MRLLLIGVLFAVSSAFHANAASISVFNNIGSGFALVQNSEIVFDTVIVDTLGTIEDDFMHRYWITVAEDLNSITSTIIFGSTAITDAVISILDFDTLVVLGSTSVVAGQEINLSYMMTNPPGSYWLMFSGTLIDAQDSYQLKISAVPLPAAIWLFGSAMIGLVGFRRRRAVGGNT